MSCLKSRFVYTGLLFLALISIASPTQAAGVPLHDVLSSRVGRLIFGELIEGSLAADRILGTRVANPELRMKRLVEVLSDSQMRNVSDDLQERLNRIYRGFVERSPSRADALFGRELAEADRRLLRELVTRELDQAFIDTLPRNDLRATRRRLADGRFRAGLTPEQRALTFWETRKNAASARSAAPIEIEHYEIPLDLVEADLAERLSPELRDALIFVKDGREHVRWVINPEDTEHYKAVEAFLKSKNVSARRHKYFEGRQTASRSYILSDPRSGNNVVFSAKVSTNNTGGAWRDKKQPFEDAVEVRRATDFVRKQEAARKFDNIVTMDEPAMFGIQAIDQAMLIRTLGELPAREVTYLPGFSAMHGELGARIARANGSGNPAAFWNEHYNKPLARALAELAARTGLTYDSPHSQNFLIEMVGINPTGRIVLRDFGDTYALADFFEASGNKAFLKRWEKDNILRGRLNASVGILHGNKMPAWMSEKLYAEWAVEYYRVFESEFEAVAGVPAELLAKTRFNASGRYFVKTYRTKGKAWEAYFKRLAEGPAIK